MSPPHRLRNLGREHLGSFVFALTFLTRVPVPWTLRGATEVPRWTLVYFPAVGALIGYATYFVFSLANAVLPGIVAATLCVAAAALVTGALHEDGLADVADGLGGGWSKEESLAIMRDSRIGSYGALALIIATLVKVGTLASADASVAYGMLLGGHVLARWSALPIMLSLPYARHDGGTGGAFAPATTMLAVVFGTAAALIPFIAVAPRAIALAWGTTIAITLLTRLYYARRIGGYTGDCLGATGQLVECAVFVVLLAGKP